MLYGVVGALQQEVGVQFLGHKQEKNQEKAVLSFSQCIYDHVVDHAVRTFL
jgi:hypothetical protein